MRVGSLFSGVGALDLGLEQAGHEVIWQVENDPAASTIISSKWPGRENLSDIREVDWRDIDRPDIIAAGYPCPDFSQAGQRRGMAGERGQLWFEVVRAIRALRPRAVILENVPGIFTAPGLALDAGESALGVVLSDLASCGFMGSYACLRASDFGAPHRRERWVAIAYAASEGGRQERGRAHQYEAEQDGSAPQADNEPGRASSSGLRTATPADTRGLVGTATGELVGGPREGSLQGARGHEGQEITGASGCAGRDWGIYSSAIETWERIAGPDPRPADPDGRLEPNFVEWMMGLPIGWTEGVARTKRLECLGNAVFVPLARYLGLALAP